MAYKPTVVFDFDGVINSYKSGWVKEDVIPDPPVPGIGGVIEALRADGYWVVVCSTRCRTEEGKVAVALYLDHNHIIVDEVTAEKPPAICYVDDRAICFDGQVDGLLSRIRNFKTWNEREKEGGGASETSCLRPCCGSYYVPSERNMVEVIGVFHGWGTDYEEFETGPGNFTTALIERSDGQMFACPAHTVKFLDRGV